MLTEHISAWLGAGINAQQITKEFDLTPAERARLADCRRLAGLAWLLFLLPGGPANLRNPPGTLRYQAERLLALF